VHAEVATNDGDLTFAAAMNGTYNGPLDLLSVDSYSVVWEQASATSVHETGTGIIRRSGGSTLEVRVDSTYGHLPRPMPTHAQAGTMTRIDLTWNGSRYTLDWACTLSPIATCPADFNGDGFIDFFDFDDFVLCFEGGGCPSGKTADFNADGFVDFFDFDDFVLAFETGC
jgi:hypothetical protein